MMKKLKLVSIIFGSILSLVVLGYFIFNYSKPGLAGIIINTNPVSSVYINGVFSGKTPFTGTNEALQINLKIVPDNSDSTLNPYETKINLVSGVKTVIEREFGQSEETSSGDVVSFEKYQGRLAGLVVISTPDNAEVWIDGAHLGITPYNFNSITTGKHKVTIKSQGYLEKTLNIKTAEGLRLTVFAKLAKDLGQEDLKASPSATPLAVKDFVIINDTPTGFLRMRTEPDSKGEEIAELKPGKKYLHLDTDVATGWYKIQYQDPAPGLPSGIVGWVSNQYSSLSTPSATIK